MKKMKKLFFTLFLAVFSVMAVFAQEQELVTLQLKSGTSITGKIIEQTSDSYKIQTAEGDVFVYRVNEVLRISNRNLQDSKVQEKAEPVKAVKEEKTINFNGDFEKGFGSIIDIGHARPIGNSYACDRSSVSYIGGYKFSRYFYAGLGLGVALTDLCCESSFDIPVYLHLRSSFLKDSKVSPYVSLNLGYNISTSDWEWDNGYYESYNSPYIEPVFGIEIYNKNKKAFSFGISMPMLTRQFSDSYSSYPALHGLGFKLGFSF